MTKKFNIVLADETYQVLSTWAAQQGRPPANLAAFLVELAIIEALRRGDIRLGSIDLSGYRTVADLVMANLQQLIDSKRFEMERLRQLMSGNAPTVEEKLRLCLILNLEEEQVDQLIKGGKKNGSADRATS